MIPVTKPFLPPKAEYQAYLDDIWERNWLTNNGPLVKEFELSLKSYLGLNHLQFVSSGTMALQLAIKALELSGEIITTPFSFVATTSSIVWEGCTPVFADIDPHSLNIDPEKIEQVITSKTTAIIATHVFGNPCDIDAISRIAKKYNLKVIYDAAHCFGTKYKGRSVLEFGDISTISFHATKVFHSTEGGAVVSNDPNIIKKIASMRNFGFGSDGEKHFQHTGINGKNSEFHAAMGLCNLKYADRILSERQEQYINYVQLLMELNVGLQQPTPGAFVNYSYFPVIFDSEATLSLMKNKLENSDIYPRRYFYPCLSDISYLAKQTLPVADSIASKICCLPLYSGLTYAQQKMIASILLRTQNRNKYLKPMKMLMRVASF